MADSCKQMLHCYDEYKRGCNRFNIQTTFMSLIFVAVFVLCSTCQIYVDGTQIDLNVYLSNNDEQKSYNVSTENMTILNKNNTGTTLHPDFSDNEIKTGILLNSEMQQRKNFTDINIRSKVSTEINPENNAFLESSTTPSENLELLIRNSVKSQIETEHLEPSSILEIFKKIPEPEIRKTLSADIISLNKVEKNMKDYLHTQKDEVQLLTIENNERNQDEQRKNVSNHQQVNIKHINSNTFGSSLDSSIVEIRKDESSVKLVNDLVEDKDVSQGKAQAAKIQIIRENNEDSHLPDDKPQLRTNSTELLIEKFDNNYNDDVLSVNLSVTIETTPYDIIESNLSKSENQKTYFKNISEEVENVEGSGVDVYLQHVVIKKVLDVQDDPLDTTIDYDNTAEETTTDVSTVMEKNERNAFLSEVFGSNFSVNTIHDFILYDKKSEMKNINEHTKPNKLVLEGATGTNYTKNIQEYIVTTEVSERHQYKQSTRPDEQTEINLESFTGQTKNYTYGDSIKDEINDRERDELEKFWEYKQSTEPIRFGESGSKFTTDNQNEPQTEGSTDSIEKYKHSNVLNEEVEPSDVEELLTSSRAVSAGPLSLPFEGIAATFFETYPPHDAGQTLNDNLADELAENRRDVPVSVFHGSNRSTFIIILSSSIAFLFIVISVIIFLISFHRQHGTLDIEMQERSCGKDDLYEEDAQTFAKLLEVKPPSLEAVPLDESEECL